ncbi:MAG TPA: PilZ domain-containing protein [Thermodesulfobacteriota bacterium]|nr:PilZ domain-containing protein [Thermodesulfobacteriota bacterium]
MDKASRDNQPTSQTRMGVLSIEKRKYPRFSVELPLNYSRAEGKEILGGMVANASEGGLLVYLPERMEIGAFLKIEIFYVRGLELDTIKSVAKVVWCDLAARESWGEHRYGLQFQYIDQKDLSRLATLLKEVGN